MPLLPQYDLHTDAGQADFTARLQRLRDSADPMHGDTRRFAEAAAANVAAVMQRGDDAVVELERRWTHPGFTHEDIRVDPADAEDALQTLDADLRGALERSIRNVTAYQRHILPAAAAPVRIGDAEVGLRHTPVDSAACLVPGGSAVLISTLIMLAVPALVAGVPANRIAVVNPAPYRVEGDDAPLPPPHPAFLATCELLGLSHVYRIGGAQAVAALARGTDRVMRADLIAGPGHPVVQIAKSLVRGRTGTDGGFYGPSEIVTLADESADPARVAADLLAQAEHDPGKCFLVAWSADVLAAVEMELARQLPALPRRTAIAAALEAESCAVLARSEEHACEIANALATEHLNLAVGADKRGRMLEQIRHAGEVFLGDATPVAAGDYHAGPSHCLPTGTTARFGSGVSVYTFLKRTGTVSYPDGMSAQTIAHIDLLARTEGLDAHAASARARA